MASLFLSFLGTNDYLPCHYYLGDYQSPLVRFVQEATIGFLIHQGTPPDRLVFFLTPEAEEKNWQDGFFKESDGTPKPGLFIRLQELVSPKQIKPVPVPAGQSEQEIWEIFATVLDEIQPEEQVIFDITHGFRSLPLLAAVILSYAKVMKHIAVTGIYYGAFEVLGPAAKNLPPAARRAPLFDLTPLVVLSDWTLAIDQFLKTGDARKVSALAHHSLKPILKETQGQHADAQALRRITNLLARFSEILATCRGQDLAPTVGQLKQALQDFSYPDLLPPFIPLLRRLQERLRPFGSTTVHDGIKAAAWCLEHNLIQQGLTILQETLINHFVLQIGGRLEDRTHRELASQAVNIYLNKIPAPDWYAPARDHPELIGTLLAFFQDHHRLAELFNNLSQARNDINHAGWVQPRPAETLAQNLRQYLQELDPLLSS